MLIMEVVASMQFTNKLREPRIILTMGGIVTIVVIGALVWFIGNYISNSNPVPEQTATYDSASHETISTTKGQAPETVNSDPNEPIYPGISKITVTQDQQNGLRQALYNFVKQQKLKTKQISTVVDTIKYIDPIESNNYQTAANFDVVFDQKTTYQANLVYSGVSQVQLYLSSKGTQVFDSGIIDTLNADDSMPDL
jgi:hypothetical protein